MKDTKEKPKDTWRGRYKPPNLGRKRKVFIVRGHAVLRKYMDLKCSQCSKVRAYNRVVPEIGNDGKLYWIEEKWCIDCGLIYRYTLPDSRLIYK